MLESEGLVAAVAALGGGPATADALAVALGSAPPGSVPARVMRVERAASQVLALGCPGRPLRVQPAGRAADPHAVGRWCVVSGLRDGGPGLMQALVPSRTALVRHGPGGRSVAQVLAADLDTVAIVLAADRRLAARAVERMLVLGYDSGASPVVVLTKTDLVDRQQLAATMAELTRLAPGCRVVPVSSATGEGTAEVRALAGDGTTLALIGASGAGKSTLANVLLQRTAGAVAELREGDSPVAARRLATGEVRGGDGRGRHTTTWRELVALPGGGALIDTPGLRSVGVWTSLDSVDAAYADVSELAGTCRFADCAHTGEPGCAITAAAESGQLNEKRLAGWRALQRQTWKQRARDSRARSRP